MDRFCPACGTQRADGAGFCARCGHGFDAEGAEAAPPAARQAQAAVEPPAASAPAPPKRPLTIGQKIVLGLLLAGFLLVSAVISEVMIHARHPHHHGF